MPKRNVILPLFVLLLSIPLGQAASQQMPAYSEASVVSLASLKPGPVAPNSLVSIFGTDLAWVTRVRGEEDLLADQLPVLLTGTGVTVMVNNLAVPVEFVSPGQVVFLMPPMQGPGTANVRLVHSGRAGPEVKLRVAATAPAFYMLQDGMVLARHGDTWEWITDEKPARPGERIMLYAGGLGATKPPLSFRRMPREEAEILRREEFSILLNGEAIAAEAIEYAGVLPGFPGLYEIRLTLPESTGEDPEIRVVQGESGSPEKIRIPLRKAATGATPAQPPAGDSESNP